MPASSAATSLPTLDISRFDAGPEEKRALVEELRGAARDVGFFYLTGHGVNPGLVAATRDLSRRFFALPEDDKLAIEMINSPHFRGYNRAGREYTRGKPDWREQVDVGPELPVLPADPAKPWRRLQGPNQWPNALPELKPTLLAYQEAVTALGIRVLRAFAAALEQPEDVFAPIYSPWPNQLTKIIRYPAAPRAGRTRASARIRTAGSSPSYCRTRLRACRSKARTVGSKRRLFRGRSSSTSVKSWRSRRTATSKPTFTGSSRLLRAVIGFRSHSSSALISTRVRRHFSCLSISPRSRAG